MNRVLIISYYYPPSPAVGAIRLNGIAKYLPEFGWEPLVLTPKSAIPREIEKYPEVIETECADIVQLWKKRLHLDSQRGKSSSDFQLGSQQLRYNQGWLRTSTYKLFHELACYPDSAIGWHDPTVNVGNKLLSTNKFDAILSSALPATTHLIANSIKKKFDIPWLADYRDLWTQSHYYPYSAIRRVFESQLEKKNMATANVITTVSEPLAEQLRKVFPHKPVFSILNGFSPDLMQERSEDLTTKFTITYTGSLYNGLRNPESLFQAIRNLIDQKMLCLDDLEIRFFGPDSDKLLLNELIRSYGLLNIVNHYGQINRLEVLRRQQESQLLLLISRDHPDEVGVYTGKVFEYLAAQRPILSIGGPPGVVSELLENTKSGIHVTTVQELEQTLRHYYNEYKSRNGVKYEGLYAKIGKYDHRSMARKFAEVLTAMIK